VNESHPRHTVICTAGHIDHGKSSLILSLTGSHPDRLKEEQEREMTIDLGFGFYSEQVTFIDVPGHEKFLRTMLAGVSAVQGAILVIAADDGVMPQTREHFDILRILNVPRGIIALTKIDLADAEWLEMVKAEIRDLTAGSFLQDAPILPVSNRTGEGIDQFRVALDQMIDQCQASSNRGIFRLWIDRSFTLKGAGTIVAGTVLSGHLKLGDRVEILPAQIAARVKRIQTHNHDVTSAGVGDRIAINLPGIEKETVERGNLLATPDSFRPTYIVNGRLDVLAGLQKPLEQRTRIRLHIGSAEYIGRLSILEGEQLFPGGTGFVQFRLETEVLANIGDRYVIRSFSEGRVLGGGVALEIHPPKQKSASAGQIERLCRRETGEPTELTRQVVIHAGASTIDATQIARELGILEEEAVDLIGGLAAEEVVTVLQGAPRWIVVETALMKELGERVLKELTAFHASKPQLKGMKKSELKSRLIPESPPILIDRVLELLGNREAIVLSGDLIALTGHKIAFSAEQEKAKDAIEAAFKASLFSPPELSVLAADLEVDPSMMEKLLRGLTELGSIVRLVDPEGKPIYYHAEALNQAKAIILQFFETHDEMKFFEFRELIGSSRKFATPLLGYWDDHGLTFRAGDVRKLQPNAKSR